MAKKAQKILAASLIGLTAMTTVPTAAFAGDITSTRLEQMTVVFSDAEMMNEMAAYAVEKNNIDLEECAKYKNIFDTAYADRDIIVNDNGMLEVKDILKNKIDEEEYNTLVADMARMNNSIQLGICSFDKTTGSFRTKELTTFVNEIKELPSSIYNESLGVERAVPSLSLGAMMRDNYTEVNTELGTQMKYNPQGAHAATTGFWVARVKPGGIWDYKVKPGYAPWNKEFNCTYGLNSSKHAIRTSEYIGNYNYGYTGSILYGLTALKGGSFIASGLDPKDVDDYPAIEEGYSDANIIE